MENRKKPAEQQTDITLSQYFSKDVYQPGVISAARIIWGSLGSAIFLGALAFFSDMLNISVLYPPLAATCFINSTCVYLRVARPKPVIVSHYVAAICGLAGSWAGTMLAGGTEYQTSCKLIFALLFATIAMQIFDADHPPAAATAAIPAILPLPMSPILFPTYMAWGATFTVFFALLWNRVWFEFPPKTDDCSVKNVGLFMMRIQVKGLGLCLLGFVLMCFRNTISSIYYLGIIIMTVGVVILGTHHLWDKTGQDT